jgi:hypothetical protein
VVAVGACVLALSISGCGSSLTYSTDDANRAFGRHGIQLVSVDDGLLPPRNGARLVPSGEGLLQPRSGEDFLVLVVSDGEANKAWSAYVAVGPAADSFDARRANVLVISDEGVGADARRRILSALAALPDRGDKVATLQAS